MRTAIPGLRHWRPIVALVVFAAGSTVAAGTPTSWAAPCSQVFKEKGWTYVNAPAWPATDTHFGGIPLVPPFNNRAAPQTTPGETSAIVGPGNSQRILISDGRSLLRSLDGGCTWLTIFSVFGTDSTNPAPGGAAVLPNDLLEVVSVPPASAAGAQKTIYVGLNNATPYVNSFAALRSDDDGQSWTVITPGAIVAGGLTLPRAAGLISQLSSAPSDPATVYACVCAQASDKALYLSRDSGRSWSAAKKLPLYHEPKVPVVDRVPPVGLTVDPRDPASLWLMTSTALYHSFDAGGTWQNSLPALTSPQNLKFYWPPSGKAPWLLTSTRATPENTSTASSNNSASTPLFSPDGGRTWKSLTPLELHLNDMGAALLE